MKEQISFYRDDIDEFMYKSRKLPSELTRWNGKKYTLSNEFTLNEFKTNQSLYLNKIEDLFDIINDEITRIKKQLSDLEDETSWLNRTINQLYNDINLLRE